MRTEEEILHEVGRCQAELTAVVDNQPYEGQLLSRIDTLLWALNAAPLQCAQCTAPLGDEPIVVTTYDDAPADADTGDDDVLLIHQRCC